MKHLKKPRVSAKASHSQGVPLWLMPRKFMSRNGNNNSIRKNAFTSVLFFAFGKYIPYRDTSTWDKGYRDKVYISASRLPYGTY